jgi:hypothetical protein
MQSPTRHKTIMNSKVIDLTGNTYGYLTVIEEVGRGKHRETLWRCQCHCGNPKVTSGASLKGGWAISCGCLLKKDIKFMTTSQGQAYVQLYLIWLDMRHKCENPQHPAYAEYGARFIRVCHEWKYMDRFLRTMAPRPPGTSLELINPRGTFNPDNCRWVPSPGNCWWKPNHTYVRHKEQQ